MESIKLRNYSMKNTMAKTSRGKKKGDITFGTLVHAFIRIPFLLIVTFFIYFAIRGQIVNNIDVQGAEMELFTQRMIYGRNSISYYDSQLERLYPGTIRLEDFSQEYFSQNVEPAIFYSEDNRIIGAKLTLLEKDGARIGDKDYVVYYNKGFFVEKDKLFRAGAGFQTGKGGVTASLTKVLVTVMEKGKARQGLLEVMILMQNV